jgi:signal peptide peptidase SppA
MTVKTENQAPKLDVSLDFTMNTDWAMTVEALAEVRENYRALPQLVANLDQPKSLEAYYAAYLENASNVRVRDGVAIIPITGPIFCEFSWYMYFFGGTALSRLMKDVQVAIDNPNVFAICFRINSPGGQVIGVNEMAKFIYEARQKIPMIAYVEGMMCSAALWLGVMAGEVVVDETSYVGSIGVCTTYLDDRKFLEKVGFEEIEIISSQSPFKNIAPYKDEGRKRIQARLDYLAERFGEAVAMGRDVTIEKVWKDFGKGDVLIGQQAIDAGLADRIATQEDCIEQLARTHAPHLYTGNTPAASLPTLNLKDGLNSDSAEEEELPDDENNPSETDDPSEEPEANENLLDKNLSREETMSTDKAKTEKPAAAEGNAENVTTAEAFAEMKNKLEEISGQLAAEKTAREAAEKLVARQKLETEMAAVAASGKFVGNETGKKTEMLVELAEKFGKESPVFKAYVEDQTALAKQIEEGELFSEKGKDGSETNSGSTAKSKLDSIAAQIAKDEKVSFDQAVVLAAERNPDIYSAYQKELQA